MATDEYCSTCRHPFSEGAAFCAFCGSARFEPPTVDQSNNRGGTNIQAGGDVHFGDQDRWDTRPRAVMDRRQQKKIWPVDLLSGVSGLITIVSFLGIGAIPNLTVPLVLLSLASAATAYFSLMTSNGLRTHGSHVLPLGIGTVERARDGSTWLTQPSAECPWCPEHNPGDMSVVSTPTGPQWVCSNTPNHRDGFDGTQLPPLLPSDV
ncbi:MULTISPECIES: hypothetical protein [Arthrobacter]|uniref:Zinc ribbon domain-containing protein n=2 Tax=Arthrobacter TaxID=1663 RepID=A0ABU9KJG0_9MICC|nr:hypothetical protein [Arthrobacter sp. YJM1]MDP5226283.1 hypothetical protein [Arthrobacter sp. YJM1]